MGKSSWARGSRAVGVFAFVALVFAPRPCVAQGTGDPFDAAQAGVDWLLPAICAWMQDGSHQDSDCTDGHVKTCLGCHVQGEGTFALARSLSRCYTLPATACALPGDENLLEFTTRFVAGTQRKACIVGPFRCNGPRQDSTTTDGRFQNIGSIGLYGDCGAKTRSLDMPMTQSVHGGIALGGYAETVSSRYSGNLLALCDWLVSRQQGTGEWALDQTLPPVSQGDAFATGSAVFALAEARRFGDAAQVASYDAALASAVAWARTATLVTNQDKAFGLLTLLGGGIGSSDPDLARIRADLQDDQLADGGWAERPGLLSNAYATGQAVFALDEAGVPLSDPATCRGIQWLVANQSASGAWSLGVRGVSTDSTLRSEFAATSWPVLVLGSLSRHGVDVLEAPAVRTTCDPTTAWTMTVRNVADDPCDLFPRTDVFSLAASNSSGDDVRVDPPSLVLAVGAEATVTVTWTRVATPPGGTSYSTLTASSDGAVALGCPSIVTRALDVRIPAPDVPFGVAVAPDAPLLETCDADVTWTITVTNTAETPCGYIATSDTIELDATNDLGDAVSVSPTSVVLLSGASTDVEIRWTRMGGPRPPGLLSTTTLRAISAGARAAGTSVEATTMRQVGSPRPTLRFGLTLDPEETQTEGCGATASWPIRVTNTADNPCGLFGGSDLYELMVTNDSGDLATVSPGFLPLAAGASGTASVTWTRVGAPRPPGEPSTTTLVATSTSARSAGLTVEATAIFGQAIPEASPRWAVSVSPASEDLVSCEATARWDLVVRNEAANACGLFPETDTFELVAINDIGDDVTVTPATVTLLQGEQATVALDWTRAGAPRDPGVVSTTSLVAKSTGARDAGLTVTAAATRLVTSPADPLPGPAPPGLRVARSGDDVLLRWDAHPDSIGGHELVEVDCLARGSCSEEPSRLVLDARAATLATPPAVLDATLRGAAAAGMPGLSYFKVRGVSACRMLPGPTCPFGCTDPRRCDAACP